MTRFLRLILTSTFIFACISTNAQEFDVRLEKLAKTIAGKINTKQKKKIAVWGFTSESGVENSALGNYLTEDFSVYITNFGDNYEIVDRNHLDIILKEHKLNSEGYIDQQTAKELGKIAAVDAIITGTYSLLPSRVKLRVKVLDTETALQFAANIADLPIHRELRGYLKLDPVKKSSPVKKNTVVQKNVTGTTPANSNESLNTNTKMDPSCKINKIGDYCFKNTSQNKIVAYIVGYQSGYSNLLYKTIVLEPGKTKCLYKFKGETIIKYYISDFDVFQVRFKGISSYMRDNDTVQFLKDSGELKAETCKSKLLTIK
jgi:TolB-like protein